MTDDSDATDVDTQTFAVSSAPPPPPPISFVGRATSNANATASPSDARVGQAGDALLLFASEGGTTALTGPGSGWVQIGRVTDGEITTMWRKVAAAGDPGSTVRLASGATFTKVAMTLAAYRGTDTTNPVASITGAGEPGNTANHVTPSVANGTNGAWRVSYWSDKNSATTTWTSPGGETSRATDVRDRRWPGEQPAHRLGGAADGRHAGQHGRADGARQRDRDDRDHVDGAAQAGFLISAGPA